MKEEIKVKIECTFDGHSIKRNGDIDLRFKAPYSEIAKSASLVRMINCNIGVHARVNNEKPEFLGTFYLNKLSFDHDGESKMVFNTELDSSEFDNFKSLFTPDAVIILLCKAVIEDE